MGWGWRRIVIVEGATNAQAGFVEDVGVYHRRGNILMTEQFLDGGKATELRR